MPGWVCRLRTRLPAFPDKGLSTVYAEVIAALAGTAASKASMARERLAAYLVHAALAGAYVGLGIILIVTIGAPLFQARSPFTPALMGAAFGVALSLVIFAGSDLFTGNTMTMPLGLLSRRTTWGDLWRVWWWSYAGNLAGSAALAAMVVLGGTLGKDPGLTFVAALAAKKMHLTFTEAFFRGILCNWLVCLSVWSAYRAKSEAGKLAMIFWCLLAFIGAGFEHSVANMTLLSLANLLPHGPEVSWAGMVHNLVPVTLGNIVAGGVFVALAYWVCSQERPSLSMSSRATGGPAVKSPHD